MSIITSLDQAAAKLRTVGNAFLDNNFNISNDMINFLAGILIFASASFNDCKIHFMNILEEIIDPVFKCYWGRHSDCPHKIHANYVLREKIDGKNFSIGISYIWPYFSSQVVG